MVRESDVGGKDNIHCQWCLFKMVMWADFLRLLLFSDSCRLGKVKSVKVEMKVVVEMVVGVA